MGRRRPGQATSRGQKQHGCWVGRLGRRAGRAGPPTTSSTRVRVEDQQLKVRRAQNLAVLGLADPGESEAEEELLGAALAGGVRPALSKAMGHAQLEIVPGFSDRVLSGEGFTLVTG